MKDLAVIILAAGKSKRMKTRMPKVLHKVGGKCLIDRVLDAVEKIEPSSIHMVVGYEKEQIIKVDLETYKNKQYRDAEKLYNHIVEQIKDKNKKHYPYVDVLKVNGMHCSGCVRNIENAFNSNEGMWAKASLEKKEVLLRSMRAVERKEAADIAHEANFTLMDIDEM